MSTHTRQITKNMRRPDVDAIHKVQPAIAIGPDTHAGHALFLRWLVVALWTAGLLAAFLNIWEICIFNVNSDGMSYLDLGGALLAGDWRSAFNAYWSPLFPLLLAVVNHAFRVSAYWEPLAARLAMLGIFAFTLGCFHFLLRESLKNRRAVEAALPGDRRREPFVSAIYLLGFSLAIHLHTRMIDLHTLTPDNLVSGFIYLACALLLRIRGGDRRIRTYALLGVCMGVGYLAKAVMFPLSLAMLGICLIASARPLRRALTGAVVAGLIFLAIAGVWIIPISAVKGRFTFGDSGMLNRAWFNYGIQNYVHWQGEGGVGAPAHPTRRILDHPPLYEFGSPAGGTYPPWFDPSYWYEGVKVPFDWRTDAGSVVRNLKFLGQILFYFSDWNKDTKFWSGRVLAGVLLALIALGWTGRAWPRRLWANWILLAAGFCGMTLYLLIIVLARYIAPFIALLVLPCILTLRLPSRRALRAVARGIVCVCGLFMIAEAMPRTGLVERKNLASALRGRIPWEENQAWSVALNLRKTGLDRGDKIALIGRGYNAYWARLAGVKIVAEVPTDEADEFFREAPDVQARVIQAVQEQTDADALVVEGNPGPDNRAARWLPIDGNVCVIHMERARK